MIFFYDLSQSLGLYVDSLNYITFVSDTQSISKRCHHHKVKRIHVRELYWCFSKVTCPCVLSSIHPLTHLLLLNFIEINFNILQESFRKLLIPLLRHHYALFTHTHSLTQDQRGHNLYSTTDARILCLNPFIVLRSFFAHLKKEILAHVLSKRGERRKDA